MPKIVKIATAIDEISAMIRDAAQDILPREAEEINLVTLPPWEFEREAPRASLFWRMGGGEDYLNYFCDYFIP